MANTISNFEWWIKENLLGIGQQSASTAAFSAPSDDTEIRYTGPRYADDFIVGTPTQESEIPSQFHRALYARVLMEHFEEQGQLRTARTWERIWDKLVREGRAYAFQDRTGAPIDVVPHDL